MALPKALVISDSVEFRETIDILLGDQFVVESLPPQAAAEPLAEGIALLVVDGGTLGSHPLPRGTTPLLLVRGHSEDLRRTQGGRRRIVLPTQFDAYALREAARSVLEEPDATPPVPTLPILKPPYLPPEAAEVARRAVLTPLPLLISGEPGTGKARVARAIHGERQAAFLLPVTADQANRRTVGELPSHLRPEDEVTLVLGEMADLEPNGQRFLADVLEIRELPTRDGRRIRTRAIVTCSHDPTALLREGRLDKSLFYQLNVLRLHIPPLRRRTEDIPALITEVSRTLCQGLGLPVVSLTEASMRRLARYLWFGNLAEMEAVLARSIAFATKPALDVGDLLFGYGPVVPRLGPTPAPSKKAPASSGATVDLIINELAHEFKNPMVTIKTFAQKLDHLRADEGDAGLVARLTGQAVERMDRALENLVQFTRFEQPTRQPTEVRELLAAALHPLEDALAEKQIDVHVGAASAQVLVDPAQVSYALTNLLQSVIRDLSNGDSLKVCAPEAGVLAIEYPSSARSAAQKLTAFLSAPQNGNEPLPLGFAFAKNLIERNGGDLKLHRGADPLAITIQLPEVVEGIEGDGESQDLNR